VSACDKINRLQSLLERVQARSGEPRHAAAHAPAAQHTNGNGAAHAAHAEHAEPEMQASAAPSVPPGARTSPPPHGDDAIEHARALMSEPPPTPAYAQSSPPPSSQQSYDVDTDSEVEVSTETVEVDIDIDEPMPLESGAQPVAQQTMPPEDLLDDAEEEQPMATQPSVRPPMHEPQEELQEIEAAPPPPPANEIEEPAPSSSRRPIAAEEAAAGAYEEESSPRHTPPPESGKQVAAAPSNPPQRKTSIPPPSLEGHTLIGGWREPGLGVPQPGVGAGAPTGVRVPAPGGSVPGTEPPATVIQGAGAVAQASGTRLSPDVTRAELGSDANVASFSGAPAVEKPKTLGDLLDMTLGL
jgi:hypothetical protein